MLSHQKTKMKWPVKFLLLSFPLGVILVIFLGGLVNPAKASAASPINLHNQTYVCKSFQDHQIVNVTNDDNGSEDGVFINDGCTGTLDVHVVTNAVDGIKIHTGDHKGLIITGSIMCQAKHGVAHQDGVQTMGGHNVQLGDGVHQGSFIVHCPTGNNGGLWINTGRGGNDVPSNIVCDHCDMFEGNAALHVGQSVDSGARNTILRHGVGGAAPADCIRIETDAGAIRPITGPNVTCIGPPPPLSSADAANYQSFAGQYGPAQTGCGLTAGGCWTADNSPPPPATPAQPSTPSTTKESTKVQPKAKAPTVTQGIEQIFEPTKAKSNAGSINYGLASNWKGWLIALTIIPIISIFLSLSITGVLVLAHIFLT